MTLIEMMKDMLMKDPARYPFLPATKEDIARAENQLSLKFAEDYTEYLLKIGAFSAGAYELNGIAHSSFDGEVVMPLDVVSETLDWLAGLKNAGFAFPPDFYLIHNLDGDILIWQNSAGEVFEWQHGWVPKKIFDSFRDYFYNDVYKRFLEEESQA